MDDPTRAGALELAAEIHAGRATAGEVVAAHLARIEELNPIVNAVCTLNPDAVAEAEAVDARNRAGGAPRPFDGVPFLA